jgi:hypothetical protein
VAVADIARGSVKLADAIAVCSKYRCGAPEAGTLGNRFNVMDERRTKSAISDSKIGISSAPGPKKSAAARKGSMK